MPLLLPASTITPLLASLTPTALTTLTHTLLTTLTTAPPSPPRTVTSHNNTKTLFMPHTTPHPPLSGTKTVSLPPPPLPATSTLTLHSASTGALTALLNATPLTPFRTALASLLIPTRPHYTALKNVVIFGSGPIAACTADLLRRWAAPGATITRLPHRGPARDDDAIKAALREADGVFCCTPSRVPLFPTAWLELEREGRGAVYVSLVGSWRVDMVEVEPALLRRHEVTVVVDGREAGLEEAGEVVQAGLGAGEVVEVAEWCSEREGEGEGKGKGEGEGREEEEKEEGCVVFCCVGLAVMDLWIGNEVCRLAREQGVGVEFSME
ncbi:hypothetical protein EDC01DRAFT_788642 [Geopyxis carbonaria]|nr:hypothetical protein EDC01DRAFT_788642 [Geopyxis carbonaria]